MQILQRRLWSGSLLGLALAVLATVIVCFSQSGAVYDGDEGLHLVAALLVHQGKQPYIDFFYWHQPLYLYLASSWMTLVGDSWRSVHLLSALLTATSAGLVGAYAYTCFQSHEWRLTGGVMAAALFALNVLVLKWSTIGHNYALCVCLSVAAFSAVTRAAGDSRVSWAALAGLLTGASTATSFLIAPLAPVVVAWLILNNGAGNWRRKLLAFLAAAAIPFAPLMLLAIEAPERTLFGVLTHHLFYRLPVGNAAEIQFEILSSWLTSPQAWLLIGLGVAGVALAGHVEEIVPAKRNAIRLCAWLVAALGLFAATMHPPVRMPYFVLVTPFLAILATAGAAAMARRIWNRPPAYLVTVVVVGFFTAALAVAVYRERLWRSEWDRIERFAAAVSEVTPPDASFYTTFSFVYFAARHAPPAGLENSHGPSIALPAERLAALRIMPSSQLAAQIRSGHFDTLVLWRQHPTIEPRELDRLYGAGRALDEYFVLWSKAGSAGR